MPTSKQRKQTARRRLERQLERRAEAARKRRHLQQIIGAIAGVAVVVAAVWFIATRVGGNDNAQAADQPSTSASPPPSASPFPTATFTKGKRAAKKTNGPCKYAENAQTMESPYTKDVGLPPDPAKTPNKGVRKVTLDTSQGAIELNLDLTKAPCTAQSIEYLVSKKYYDNTFCHRLTTGQGLQVLQCGDASGTGSGGPTYQMKEEVAKDAKYTRGVVAMAKSQAAGTTSSQFFLVYGDSQLPAQYTVVGTVSPAGLAVIDKVAQAGSDNSNGEGDGKPVAGITIKTAKLG